MQIRPRPPAPPPLAGRAPEARFALSCRCPPTLRIPGLGSLRRYPSPASAGTPAPPVSQFPPRAERSGRARPARRASKAPRRSVGFGVFSFFRETAGPSFSPPERWNLMRKVLKLPFVIKENDFGEGKEVVQRMLHLADG
ncbi:hypothetical protein DV515_00013613 [Chloebia gouldiae]|uniref:Uncharacterized protein n=1 Tax=Chloebia gouldiae TaxID=44316 RepID=A0A3L8S1T0_CHLGU|nr:hypothetical protein DV515_00013613 [Chloebia gouldiae]